MNSYFGDIDIGECSKSVFKILQSDMDLSVNSINNSNDDNSSSNNNNNNNNNNPNNKIIKKLSLYCMAEIDVITNLPAKKVEGFCKSVLSSIHLQDEDEKNSSILEKKSNDFRKSQMICKQINGLFLHHISKKNNIILRNND